MLLNEAVKMSKQDLWQLLFALVIHLLFVCSVFDIYFCSPVISSERHHSPKYDAQAAPAKRLVLFVADGLRAQSVFDYPERTPFLRKVANSLGGYGVSHTKLPTESRPGHVALIGGMFEDPSAITKGWQENPVDFDTVFNQSQNVWSWGSPDILPIFAKTAEKGKVRTEMYKPEDESFFEHQDISKLDTWVFDKVDAFFKNNADNEVLRRSDRTILFLHLLGLDTNGHSNKPHSPQFEHNLRIVDQGVQEVVRQCESFWGHDGRTSYIFTSDHGMTDWGSHGAGMDHETQTPIFVWGGGIRGPQVGRTSVPQFSSKKSHDVNQTDVAPLMSALLGLNYPQHSLGKVPLDFLSLHPSDKVEVKVANALQIYEQYLSFKKKRTDTFLSSPLSSRQADPFAEMDELDTVLSQIQTLKSRAKFDSALKVANDLFDISYKALFHYQRYHRIPLYIAASFTYLGFIFYIVLQIVQDYTSLVIKKKEEDVKIIVYALATFGFCYSLLATLGQNVPWHFFFYYFCPFVVWTKVLNLVLSVQMAPTVPSNNYAEIAKSLILYLINIECLVGSFFDRRCMSVAMALIMYLHRTDDKRLMCFWSFCCIALSAFTFTPTVGKERMPNLVLMSSIASGFLGTVIQPDKGTFATNLQGFNTVISGICVVLANNADGWASYARTISWMLMIVSLPLAFVSHPRKGLWARLISSNLALMTVYQLFSLTYESLFLLTLVSAMSLWLMIEHQKYLGYTDLKHISVIKDPRQRSIVDNDDWKRALTFLTFAIVSFFGTGNIASLNSFDPRSIQTLVTTFSPFLMGGLLLLKVVLPFLVVALFAYCVQYVTQMPRKALFLMVLIFSDIMGLHFFFLVTDQGSWLDIGTSLSHFIIVEGTVIFLQLMFMSASFFIKFNNLEAIDTNDAFIIKHE